MDTGGPLLPSDPTPAVWINEVMPENDSTWQLPDGALPAWIEIRNASERGLDRADLTLNGEPIAWVDTGDKLDPAEIALASLADNGKQELAWRGTTTDTIDPGHPGPDVAWARFDALFDGDASGFELTGQATPALRRGLRGRSTRGVGSRDPPGLRHG